VIVFFTVIYREYRKVFHTRGKEPTRFYEYFFSEFPGLSAEPFYCMSGEEKLYGIRLSYKEAPKGLIVMMHGYGMNMENYLPQAEYLARAGYAVILFDGTGVGRSTGDKIRGLSQHVADAAAVLDYIENEGGFAALPLLLYGHSSGGYAACAVSCKKTYPIRAIVSVAAYIEPLGGMKATLWKRYGIFSLILMGPLAVIQCAEFGRRASGYNSVKGLGLTNCPVLVIHSENDPVVPFEKNFSKIQKAFSDRPGFRFRVVKAKNHNLGVPADVKKRVRQLQKQIDEEPAAAERKIQEMMALQMQIDEEMLAEFCEFYDSV